MADYLDPVKIGVMWQKMETMEKEVSELRDDVKQLLALANKGRGGLWVGMTIASFAGALITYITSFFLHK